MSKKYKFFNLPKKCTLKDYKISTDKIVKKYSKTKNLVSLYEWGSVSTLGISDIDIVFVFHNKKISPLPLSKRSYYLNDSKTRYLCRHPFVFIDERALEKIRYINHHINFNLLFGKKCKINKLSPKEINLVKISLLNDLIIRHYPRDFLSQSINKKINVRDSLLRLNSLRYTINTFESITKGKNKSWGAVTKKIEGLRKNWFKTKDFDSLVKLNNEAVDITMEIIENFRDILLKNKLVKINYGDKLRYNGAKNKSLFVKDWNKDSALEIMKKKSYSVLPLELAPQLIEYSRHNGKISSYIRKNLLGNLKYGLKHENIIKNRAEILNAQSLLAHRLKHSDFPAFFDFGYRSKSGINNWVLNILDEIKY